MKPVIAQFIIYPKKNQKAGGQSDGQTENIDEAVELIFLDNPRGNQYVILEHHDLRMIYIQVSCQERTEWVFQI